MLVRMSALIGTPRLFSLPRNFGALPSFASTQSTRVEAYMPELPADSTEDKMTAFITEAAKAKPAFSNTSVNGLALMLLTSLDSKLGCVYGMIIAITKMAKM